MNSVIYIYIICIIIEIYHIVFHRFVNSVESGIIKSFQTLDKFHKGMKMFAEAGKGWGNDSTLKNVLGECPTLMNEDVVKDYIQQSKRKLVSSYDSKYIIKFAFEQLIELIYWTLSIVIIFKDFPRGIIVFVALLILSHMHKNVSNSFKYFYLFDSLFCIVMYITCISSLV